MTTEDGAPGPTRRARTVTRLPERGSVLVRSAAPPATPAVRCVDVRPGPQATFDGDRLRMSLSVGDGAERARFDRSELPAIEEAVIARLLSGPAAGAPRGVVRFGDRGACRRLLPAASVSAIERRLSGAADRAGGALLTWTASGPRPGDYLTYDVVLDGPDRAAPPP